MSEKPPETKKEAFSKLLNQFHEILGNNGCNDFFVANTPEMYELLELAGARNLNLSLEDFRKSEDYEDYKPHVSTDGKLIYGHDFEILSAIEEELGL